MLKSKVKQTWICVAHRREHASNVLPLISNTARPRIRASVSRDVPVYFPAFVGTR